VADARFDVLVFDWDGTLVDSTALIANAILRAAADIGVAVPDPARASHVIGLGMAHALALVVPDLPRERRNDFNARFHVHYRNGEDDICLFEGMRALLESLQVRGERLAIATGKSSTGLMRSLHSAGLEGIFEATRCADQTHPKPHPAMLLELAQEMETEPARMLMIGDTTHDLQMAQAAGASAVGVSYGAHPHEELARAGPLAIFNDVAGLRSWLLR